MLLKIHPVNPDARNIGMAVDILRNGGIIIYPTDTVYGIGCDITNQKAVERIARIKGIKPDKHNFSFICYDLSNLSHYTRVVDTNVYKLMKRNLPGPFTFILNANGNVPKMFKNKKKTVGIRIPDNKIIRELVKELGNPILSTSVRDKDDVLEYMTDPELIYEEYRDIVDAVIDGGYVSAKASTVVDCTTAEINIIRQGKGELQEG